MQARHGECQCPLPDGWRGTDGSHMVHALSDFCWRFGKWREETSPGDSERVLTCNCQRRVQLPSGEILRQPLAPVCIYEGQWFVMEHCPAYIAATNRQRVETNRKRKIDGKTKFLLMVKISSEDKLLLVEDKERDRFGDSQTVEV